MDEVLVSTPVTDAPVTSSPVSQVLPPTTVRGHLTSAAKLAAARMTPRRAVAPTAEQLARPATVGDVARECRTRFWTSAIATAIAIAALGIASASAWRLSGVSQTVTSITKSLTPASDANTRLASANKSWTSRWFGW